MKPRKLLFVRQKRHADKVFLGDLLTDWYVEPLTYQQAASLKPPLPPVGIVLVDSLTVLPELEEVLAISPDVQWIVITQSELIADPGLRQVIRECCFDFHTLPLDSQRLRVTLGHALGMAQLQDSEPEDLALQGEMVGASAAMQRLFRLIRKVAKVDAPVLIQGESGTGKELAARALHERSERASGPFVAVNCGALPATLVQSELFGHERGAFTGANQRKIGRIEAAAGGTIFLDEIGDLPLDLQVNLLRFLQERTIERIGSTKPIHVDVRVIAATHVDLEAAVAANRFRADLYYRLNVLRLELPPLRERQSDIEVLARYFFDRFTADKAPCVKGFSRRALEVMQCHDWPGNVRELMNRVQRAMVMCDRRLISPVDLGLEPAAAGGERTLSEVRADAEREAVEQALRSAAGNISKAAAALRISRVTLYRLIDKYKIRISTSALSPEDEPAAARTDVAARI